MERSFAASLLAALLAFAAAAAFLALAAAGPARAECACRCVGGEMRAICSNPLELAPICPPAVCPVAPPELRPIAPPVIPPPGTRDCSERQVLNPWTGRWEWQLLCR